MRNLSCLLPLKKKGCHSNQSNTSLGSYLSNKIVNKQMDNRRQTGGTNIFISASCEPSKKHEIARQVKINNVIKFS